MLCCIPLCLRLQCSGVLLQFLGDVMMVVLLGCADELLALGVVAAVRRSAHLAQGLDGFLLETVLPRLVLTGDGLQTVLEIMHAVIHLLLQLVRVDVRGWQEALHHFRPAGSLPESRLQLLLPSLCCQFDLQLHAERVIFVSRLFAHLLLGMLDAGRQRHG